jgi:hypothetical protein
VNTIESEVSSRSITLKKAEIDDHMKLAIAEINALSEQIKIIYAERKTFYESNKIKNIKRLWVQQQSHSLSSLQQASNNAIYSKVNEYKVARDLIESNLLTTKKQLSTQRKIIYELNKESICLPKKEKKAAENLRGGIINQKAKQRVK